VPDLKDFSYGPTSGLAGFRSAELLANIKALPLTEMARNPKPERQELKGALFALILITTCAVLAVVLVKLGS
jgi:hypothetical protein